VIRLSESELRAIRDRCEATPPGPWHAMQVLHCHQLVANAVLDLRGRLQRVGATPPIVILETEAGRRFVVQARDDVERLLAHIEELELVRLELEARLARMRRGETD
jgi:hypothetical protein